MYIQCFHPLTFHLLDVRMNQGAMYLRKTAYLRLGRRLPKLEEISLPKAHVFFVPALPGKPTSANSFLLPSRETDMQCTEAAILSLQLSVTL